VTWLGLLLLALPAGAIAGSEPGFRAFEGCWRGPGTAQDVERIRFHKKGHDLRCHWERVGLTGSVKQLLLRSESDYTIHLRDRQQRVTAAWESFEVEPFRWTVATDSLLSFTNGESTCWFRVESDSTMSVRDDRDRTWRFLFEPCLEGDR
jgi:hypothetical protein